MLCPLLDVQGDKSKAILPHINNLFVCERKPSISSFTYYLTYQVIYLNSFFGTGYDVFWVGLVEC